jgi:hypothetical protein
VALSQQKVAERHIAAVCPSVCVEQIENFMTFDVGKFE